MKSINQLIGDFLIPHLEKFVEIAMDENAEFMGIKVLEEKEKLVLGKIIETNAALYIHYNKLSLDKQYKYLGYLNKKLAEVVPGSLKTWGKLSTLSAFVALKKAGLLETVDADLTDTLFLSRAKYPITLQNLKIHCRNSLRKILRMHAI